MDDDGLKLPIFHDPTLALQLMDLTNSHEDDDAIRHAVAERVAAAESLAKARRAHARAVRVGDAYPKEDLAVLKARLTRCEIDCDNLSARLRDHADRRLRRARDRRAEALNDALARPSNVDPVSDRLDRAEWQRRLEALAPDERTLMVTTAAKEGTAPALVRAALLAESPLWPTPSWQPLLEEKVAEEVREFIMARRSPSSVADVRAAWRLRRLAFDLDQDRAGFPRSGTPPGLDLLNARPEKAT